MSSNEHDGATWRARLEALLESLRANPGITVVDAEIGPPATDTQVAAASAAAGFDLSPAFLAYFRSANGCRITWVERAASDRDEALAAWRSHRLEGGTFGAIDVPPIEALCARPAHPPFGAGTPGHHVPLLGGWDDVELRAALRDFDRLDAPLGSGETPFRGIALVLHPRLPDPVVLMTEDYGAAIADRWPLRARAYLELLAVDGGTPLRETWFKAAGFAGDHPVVDFSRAELGDGFQGSTDWDRVMEQTQRELAIKRRVGILPPVTEPGPAPLERRVWTSPGVPLGALLAEVEALAIHDRVIPTPSFTSLTVTPRGVIDLVGDPVQEVEANLPAELHDRLAPVLDRHGFART